MKKKDVSTINNSVYYDSDKHADTISDSSKHVHASNDPIKDTHIVEGINNLSVGIVYVSQPSSESESMDRSSPKAILTEAQTFAATSPRTY